MTDIAARLQSLEDRLAITELIARYGPRVDAGQGDALAQDWTEDALYQGGDFAFTGRDAIAALTDYPAHQAFMAQGCAHVMGPHAITVTGDTASARGTSLVITHDAAQGRWQIARASANHWQFRRTAAGWRIARRENRLLDGDAAARALLTDQTAPVPTPAPTRHEGDTP